MKLVVAIFKPFRLDCVLEALQPLAPRMLHHTEVRGYGRQKGNLDAYEGSEVAIEFIPKIRLEFAIAEPHVEDAVRAICSAARTGRIGDGKIFIFAAQTPGLPPRAPV